MMYWNVCSHITYWLFPGSLMNLPRFIPFSSTPCPWISAHWFYICISIRQGLKKIKSIKFKTNHFSCFRRKKVGNSWPETKKNENYWSISRLCVSLPWVWSRFLCSLRPFCPLAISSHTHVSPSSLSICFYCRKHLFLSLFHPQLNFRSLPI